MFFDFDTPIDRSGTFSEKWDRYGSDVIPLWVADMDFAAPQPILDALSARVQHGVFGYTHVPAELREIFCEHVRNHHGWEISPEWLVPIPGLVCGLNVTCAAVGQPGDSVLTATPVYPPFFTAPTNAQRSVVRVPLVQTGERWHFDFDRVKDAIRPDTRLFLLCNPHNPVGRCFDRDELLAVADLCERHDLVLCSDEIHNELILDQNKRHIPIASLDAEIARRTITLMAPSKTFNIPGLGASMAIISDADLRARFQRAMAGIVPHINVMGVVATLAAYRSCADWHRALLDYLRQNRDVVADELGQISGLHPSPVEATYLTWIDARALPVPDPTQFFEQAGVGLSDGRFFGAPGFLRLNFGGPRSLLREALRRMRAAVGQLQG